jgi:flagellar secretion chaperone FliS
MNHHARKSYQQVATQTASSGQLILMLYDGAIRFLETSLTGFGKEDPVECIQTIHNNINRAQDIIRELNISLNLQEGGELAVHLRQVYDYMDWRLQDSNIKKEEEGINDVIRRLVVLRNAWSSMLQNQTGDVNAAAIIAGAAATA